MFDQIHMFIVELLLVGKVIRHVLEKHVKNKHNGKRRKNPLQIVLLLLW